jgi:hypothetical protein
MTMFSMEMQSVRMTHPPTQPVQGGYAESIERELAEAKAENAKLRADLENERSQKVSTNSQDDPCAA